MTVIVGYTPTPLGRQVLEAAIDEAARRDVDLVLVNSATGASYADKGLAPQDELDEAVAEAQTRGVRARVQQVTDALAPAQTLLDEAARAKADLIVIGLRSRSRTGKFLMGSTAQTVLLGAPCNVLAVRDTRG
ncbi:universal stress protein [Nocardia sp. N13]|uniref:universal stress protein n=1 Tax=Nocardioides sp. N13(2025) TaxID=3453405 RepID=UPI003F75CEDE